VYPERFPGLDVEGVEEAGEVRQVEDAVLERAGGDAAADRVVVPQASRFGDVAPLGASMA